MYLTSTITSLAIFQNHSHMQYPLTDSCYMTALCTLCKYIEFVKNVMGWHISYCKMCYYVQKHCESL